MVGLPASLVPGHPNPSAAIRPLVRPGVNLIDHGTDPEEAGQKTTKTFRARLSSRWEVRSLLFESSDSAPCAASLSAAAV